MTSEKVIVRTMKAACIALVCLVALAPPVLAKDKPRLRHITLTEATSNCIGRPVTPLCAVETLLACDVWRERRLCEIAGVTEPVDEVSFRGWPMRYILVAIRGRTCNADQPCDASTVKRAVLLRASVLSPSLGTQWTPWTRAWFDVVRIGDRWAVVGVSEFVAPALP